MSLGWEVMFRLACLERRGDAYQELFAAIMERRDVGFERVRPWGSAGDRKNDGWSPGRRELFQCYAPSTLSAANLANKLDYDYEGAKDYWSDYFDKWIFVHDDLDGMSPLVATKIAELNARSDDIECSAWGIEQLRAEFAELHEADRVAILGPALTPNAFLSIGAESLKPLIEALGHQRPDPAAEVRAVPAGKIYANELLEPQVEFLKLGSARAPLVENYLTNAFVIPAHADAVAESVSERYVQLRSDGLESAEIFDRMVAWVSGGSIDSNSLAHALAILAYFFERCHIFEVPAEAES